jgi:hypothetical protein
MAGADYRKCDKCNRKVFYDSDLSYEFQKFDITRGKMVFEYEETKPIKGETHALGCLGDWKVLCHKCAETHKCIIVERGDKE